MLCFSVSGLEQPEGISLNLARMSTWTQGRTDQNLVVKTGFLPVITES